MPLPGGPSDKLGNRYEGLWTVHCMVDVMDEAADSIRLEPPGDEGEGIEFWLQREAIREYHQVKRQQSTSGHWTIEALTGKGILTNFFEKLKDTAAQCTFVSIQDAYQLRELTERARDAASYAEFCNIFLQAREIEKNFLKICSYWSNCPHPQAFEALRRTHVTSIEENLLRKHVETQLKTLVEGNPRNALDILAQLALESIHKELTAYDIWQHLESRNVKRRQWHRDPHVLAAIEKANERYRDSCKRELITGKLIPRPEETQAILNWFTSPIGKRGMLITGEAGIGKSSVLLQVIENLRGQGFPLLAFRVDRLKELTILPDEVGEQNGLPGSPANVLASIAQKKNGLLIIDQLDAVSLISGRQPKLFECIQEIIEQAEAHSNIRLLLACRKFDLENDPRLRKLTGPKNLADTVLVGRLNTDSVKKLVSEWGLAPNRLSTKQLELLTVPLHLKLFEEIFQRSNNDVPHFTTAKDLYDIFGEHKQRAINTRLGYSVQWANILYTLADYMSKHQTLSAPVAVLDEYGLDAQAMVSEHVLVLDNNRFSFFHEGFFDYCFARQFIAKEDSLVNVLLSGEQHLFRRVQVRQILLHLRDADRFRYLNELNALLNPPNIRFHIKQVVFALVHQLSDPTEQEWLILSPIMDDLNHAFYWEAWGVLHSSDAWFRLVDSLGILERWLADEKSERIDRTVTLLSRVLETQADRVAELLESYVGRSEEWNKRLIYIMQWGQLGTGRRLFNLFLRLIDEGVLDEARGPIAINSEFWDLIYSLPDKRPDWACEVIGHYMHRRLTLSLAEGQTDPFHSKIPHSQLTDAIFIKSARSAPLAFYKQAFSFMRRVTELNPIDGDKKPKCNRVWSCRDIGKWYSVSGALLQAMEIAFSELAKQQPSTFAEIASELTSLDCDTVQFLLVRAYTANGKYFTNEAVDYLLENSIHLETGYLNNPHWATRELLRAITPHCSVERLKRLESIILNYYPAREKTPYGRKDYGYAQFTLLGGIGLDSLSRSGKRRFQEWQRKFCRESAEEPQNIIRGGSVISPIPESAIAKMTDKQWLCAIARYNNDNDNIRKWRNDNPVGGAIQLSADLEKRAKEEPKRFASLVLRLPDDTHPYYFNAVLRGITSAKLDTQTVLDVCRRCHRLPERPCGMSITRLVATLNEQQLPDELLDIVAWYATEDPNPDRELWRTKASSGDFYYRGDIAMAAINSVRGSAAEDMGTLIYHDGNRINYFLPTLERMVQDPSIAVRSNVAATLTAVLKHNRSLAVKLFIRLCETEEVLLGTWHVERFLHYSLITHFKLLAPILKRMVQSDIPSVATAGARQVCLATLELEEAQPLAEECLSGNESQREGAAQIFAANLHTARFREYCESALKRLFYDDSDKVRKEAAQCFARFKDAEIADYVGLVKAFTASPAFLSDSYRLVRALEEATVSVSEIMVHVTEYFLDVFGKEATNIRTAKAGEVDTISKLILRGYSQSGNDKKLQVRYLDLIDKMLAMRLPGLDSALASYER